MATPAGDEGKAKEGGDAPSTVTLAELLPQVKSVASQVRALTDAPCSFGLWAAVRCSAC